VSEAGLLQMVPQQRELATWSELLQVVSPQTRQVGEAEQFPQRPRSMGIISDGRSTGAIGELVDATLLGGAAGGPMGATRKLDWCR
jgi:hypothetical protein